MAAADSATLQVVQPDVPTENDRTNLKAETNGFHPSKSPSLPRNIFLSEPKHQLKNMFEASEEPTDTGPLKMYRVKDRQMKTGCIALVLCLNIGVDPPDVIKISPCARLECWIDPAGKHADKPLQAISNALTAQYTRWQSRAKFRPLLDPALDDVKKLCSSSRKSAKSERVLFHYNGHGVPRATANGEIWFFNRTYTQYIPLSVYELDNWLGSPSIYVLDCSAAGAIVNAFCDKPEWTTILNGSSSSPSPTRDCILLAACAADETLPQNADFPADVFTACLTTPITMALRWFCPRSLLKDTLTPAMIDNIPGVQSNRKTPLGELNWIFTAITDTIAWNVLPKDLFQRLFRQDLLVASLFRNFLLAERIMRTANCTPQSYPRLPPTHQHHMWYAWDMAAEMCLAQLPRLMEDPTAEFQPSSFFSEQLMAFEVWLEHGSESKKPPEQLPIVLQVLLSQSHRRRALILLGKFLDMGAWAVELALSVGIYPYVLKLLQTSATDVRHILVFIWTKILAVDKFFQVELVKDSGHVYFIRALGTADAYGDSREGSEAASQRALAAFVLAVICDRHRAGQIACLQAGLLDTCLIHVQAAPPSEPLLLQWLCFCLAKFWDGFPEAQVCAIDQNAHRIVGKLLEEPLAEVRASAIYALGALFSSPGDGVPESRSKEECSVEDEEAQDRKMEVERKVGKQLLSVLSDGSPFVRMELMIALSRFVSSHLSEFRRATSYHRPPSAFLRITPPYMTAGRNIAAAYSPQLTIGSDGRLAVRIGSMGSSFGSFRSSALLSRSLDATSAAMAAAASPASLSSFVSDGDDAVTYRSTGQSSSSKGTPAAQEDETLPRGSRGGKEVIYNDCVSAILTLTRDPCPDIGALAVKIARGLGLEPVVARPATSHGRSPSMDSDRQHGGVNIPASSHAVRGLQRSSSWVSSPGTNLAGTIRQNFVPVSPSSNFLEASEMRRAASMDFQPPAIPESMSAVRISRNQPISTSSLAKALSEIVTPSQTGEQVSVVKSSLYVKSCQHFCKPLLEPSFDDHAEALRLERERRANQGILVCQTSKDTKVCDQICSFDTESNLSTQAIVLHPFRPIVCMADEKETIRIWNYEDGTTVNTFENRNGLDVGVSKLCLLNELDDSLLLVASADGSVRVWKDYTREKEQNLVSGFQAIHTQEPLSIPILKNEVVVEWHQHKGYFFASGGSSSIVVWDLLEERVVSVIPTKTESHVTAMSSSHVHGGLLAVGCRDGSIRVFDIRSRDSYKLSCASKPHNHRVVGVDFQPGSDSKLVSASTTGDLKFLDARKSGLPYHSLEAHKGSLSCLAVHRHAPILATGSSKQHIKVFDMNGEVMNVVRYHSSFLGQQIGPVSSLQFHPYSFLLAAGSTDSIVSMYASETAR